MTLHDGGGRAVSEGAETKRQLVGGGSSITGSVGTVYPGDEVNYIITVTNPGSTEIDGVVMQDPLLSSGNFLDDSYTTFPTGGATDSNPTGSGDIDDTVNLPPDSSITYTVTADLSCSVESGSVLTNTATLTPPSGPTLSAIDTDTIGPNEC